MPPLPSLTVLHYVGCDDDRGGIVSVVRALSHEGLFAQVLGVNAGFRAERGSLPPTLELPRMRGEGIGWWNFGNALRVAWVVRRWLRAEPGRIFHGRSRTGLLVALWLRFWGERAVVVSVHCLGRQRWFYSAAAAVLGPRLVWLGPAMKRHYRLSDTSWTGCVPDCVVPGEFGIRSIGDRRDGRVCIGCVGGLVEVKRWDLVLRALSLLPRAIPIFVIHAGGEDGSPESADCARELRRIAVELGIADRVEWRGLVRNMAEFYAEIDVLLVASHWEASSVAALEAISCGVPVLASDGAGTRDLVETARAGWLFPADDPAALAETIAGLLRGAAVREFRIDPENLRPFSAAVVARQWVEIYRQCLSVR